MASLNKIQLIGNAGRDAELRYTASGTAQSKFSVATSYSTKKGDEWEEHTEWHNVVVWGDLAERISAKVAKGKQLYVEGRLQTRSWDDDQGVKHYMTEVVANTVLLLGKNEHTDDGGRGWEKPSASLDVDDLPFE